MYLWLLLNVSIYTMKEKCYHEMITHITLVAFDIRDAESVKCCVILCIIFNADQMCTKFSSKMTMKPMKRFCIFDMLFEYYIPFKMDICCRHTHTCSIHLPCTRQYIYPIDQQFHGKYGTG